MRPFILAAALAAAILAAPASASSVTYTYRGQDFGFLDLTTRKWVPCASDPTARECEFTGARWTGSLTLTDQYPAQIAGSTLRLVLANYETETPCDLAWSQLCYFYTVTAANGSVYSGHVISPRRGWDALGIIRYDGHLAQFLDWSEDYGSFTFAFGDRGQITSWYGRTRLFVDGRAFMPQSSGTAPGTNDYNQDGSYTLGPGVWSGSAPPQPVPVPATAALLASALGGLGTNMSAKRRRQAVV